MHKIRFRNQPSLSPKETQPVWTLISGGLGLQWFEAEFLFPTRELGFTTEVRAPNPSHCTRDQCQDAGPLALQKRIPTKRESSGTTRVFTRNEKSTVCEVWLSGGLKGKVRSCDSSSHSYGAFLLVFLWQIIFLCLVQSPYLVYLRVPHGCTRIS